MATAGPEINDRAYLAGCSRVLSHVVDLVQTRGLAMSADIDPGRASCDAIVTTHQIQLTYGRSTHVVSVEPETLMNEEFFQTSVLHQLEAAIDKLAASA